MVEVVLFYATATIAIIATTLAVTRYNVAHALIYLIISLLASAVIFFLLGAPFAAVLEVLIYAGAIMVLFVFVIMMLNLGSAGALQEQVLLRPVMWAFPSLLAIVLLIEMVYVLSHAEHLLQGVVIGPKLVGIKLFGAYVLAVEIASMLLLAGLVGAFHLGRSYLFPGRVPATSKDQETTAGSGEIAP